MWEQVSRRLLDERGARETKLNAINIAAIAACHAPFVQDAGQHLLQFDRMVEARLELLIDDQQLSLFDFRRQHIQ